MTLHCLQTAAARARQDDPNADKFLQYFYENGVALLLDPLTKGLVPAEPGESHSVATDPPSCRGVC